MNRNSNAASWFDTTRPKVLGGLLLGAGVVLTNLTSLGERARRHRHRG